MHFVRGTLVAAITLLLVNLAYSAKAEGRTRVLCLSAYDDEFFYFAASVQKPNLVGRNVKIFSDPIADDAVAVFLQTEDSPQMTKRTDKSVELAVSAAGGSQLYRGTGAVPLKDYSDLLKGPGGIPIPFKYRTTTTGRLNAPGDAKTGYVVEMAIPWIEFGGPPKTGQRMKMNVVAFSAATGSPPILSLSSGVKSAADVQNPSLWQEIIFVDAAVKSAPDAPNAKVCARVFANKPFVDGTITEGEWNTLTAFGFSEAEAGGGSATFNPAAATARLRPTVALKKAPPGLPLKTRPTRTLPARIAQSVPKLVFSLYHYDVQCDPRKALPLLSVRQSNGRSLLTTHPLSGTGPWMTYDRVDWHRAQLLEMREAGIDVVLPVFRASAMAKQQYSIRGLSNLVAAVRALEKSNRDYPAIGLFLDTNSVSGPSAEKIDLKEPGGQAALYGAIKDFYLQVPNRYRISLAIDHNGGGGAANIVVLSSAAPFADIDQSFVEYCRNHFAADFGVDLLILGSSDFKPKAKLDGYVNDTAGKGFNMDDIGWIKSAAIGVDSLKSEKKSVVVMPEAADAYKNNWKQVLAKKPDWVFVDGWNEYGSGSEIAATLERGVNLTDITHVFTRVMGATDPIRVSFINNNCPSAALAGTNCSISVRLQNIGQEIWNPETHAVSFAWQSASGEKVQAGAFPFISEIAPGTTQTVRISVPIPGKSGMYILSLDVGRVDKRPAGPGQPARFLSTGGLPLSCTVRVGSVSDTFLPSHAVTIVTSDLPGTVEVGGTYQVVVRLRNDGSQVWKQAEGSRITARLWKRSPDMKANGRADGFEPVDLADATAVLPADVPPGHEATVTVPITFSQADGGTLSSSLNSDTWNYELRWEVAMTSDGKGGALTDPEPLALADADIGIVFTHDHTPDQLPGDRRMPVKLGLRNAGPQTWRKDLARIGYHWYYLDGTEAVWEDETTAIPQDVEPGAEVPDILAWITPPPNDGAYWLVWDLKVGDTWTSTLPSIRPHETQVDRVQVIRGHLTFVDLSAAYNLCGISDDSARAGGNFDGAGRSLPAELVPPFATTDIAPSSLWIVDKGSGLNSSRAISFRWGPKGFKENNIVQCVGQKITVEPNAKKSEPFKAVHLLAAATAPGVTGAFTLQFSDGTQQFSSFPLSSWEGPPSPEDDIAFGVRRTHTAAGDALDKPAVLYRYTIAIREPKKLTAILLPNVPTIKIVAITLEKP